MSLVNINLWIWMSKENLTIYKSTRGVSAVTRKNGPLINFRSREEVKDGCGGLVKR